MPPPALYLLRADNGRRVDARMSGAASIADGATSTVEAAFDTPLAAEDVGIMVLLIGRDNYGAFLPPTG